MPLANITQLEPFNINTSATFTFANITSSGNITAAYLIGNGSQLTGLSASYANSNVASYLPTYSGLVGGTLSTAAQPNITSVGTLSSVSITGLTTATGGVKTANILDTSGTVTLQTKYNSTSGDVGVVGNLVVGTGGTGNVTATYFIGDGSLLTGISGGSSYSNSNVAAYLPTYTGNVNANYFIGNGSTLTHITGGNVDGQVSNSLVAGTVYTNSQPNITSVGTLTSLTVSTTANVGTLNATDSVVSGNVVISGNLTVSGTTEYTNVTNLYVKDPIIEMGGGANNAALSSNDGKDRGTLLHYYTTAPVDAFMGWDNSNGEFAFGSNVSLSSEVVTFNTLGNVRASTFIGALSGEATTAATVTTNAQPNITSVGTLTSLSVTGNVTAAYLIGNGSQLTGLSASYANSNVASYLPTYTGLVGGTLSTAAQPNITSVGTIANLTVSGIITTANATEVKTAPTISSGTLTINLNTASVFDVALNANITTLTLTNVQASGYTSSFVLIFTADGTARSVTWPVSFKWPSGTAPTITSTSGKKDVFVFFTVDGGTSWQAFISGQNL